jgi:hypothetical protein
MGTKKKINKEIKKAKEEIKLLNARIKKTELQSREYYLLRSILGYWWAIFFFLLGGREAGKSYAVTDFFVKQFKEYGRPFYWLRLSETSAKKLLSNNAEKLVDPDLRRKYKLDLVTNGENVYQVIRRSKPDKKGKTKVLEKKLMARVLSIATFYNDKGSGYFDKDFLDNPDMWYNICLDEMNREKSEKNSFDIVYSFTNQLENLIRSTKGRVRVICIGNTLEEASDLLCSFNFIPEEFGRFKLVKNKKKLKLLLDELKKPKELQDKKKIFELNKTNFGKRAIIEYIEPSEAYKNRRSGTIADILMPEASTFTNKIDTDTSLVYKGRLTSPIKIIKFSKDKADWFTLWDGNVISCYNKENKSVIAMRPYIDELFEPKLRDNIIQMFDYRTFKYRDLITFKKFQKNINLLKPRGC